MKNSLILALVIYLVVSGITNRLDNIKISNKLEVLTKSINKEAHTNNKVYSLLISNSMWLRTHSSLLQDNLNL